MSPEEVLTFGRDAIFLTLRIALPLLIAGLIVGLVVSLFQSLTQIQEQTLTFIPKIIVVFLVLLLLLPSIGAQFGLFMAIVADKIISIG